MQNSPTLEAYETLAGPALIEKGQETNGQRTTELGMDKNMCLTVCQETEIKHYKRLFWNWNSKGGPTEDVVKRSFLTKIGFSSHRVSPQIANRQLQRLT